jgi:hypothetical protein
MSTQNFLLYVSLIYESSLSINVETEHLIRKDKYVQ